MFAINNNMIVVIFTVINTYTIIFCQARLFYLPLPKFHEHHQAAVEINNNNNNNNNNNVDHPLPVVVKESNVKKNKNDHDQAANKKRDDLDWDSLIDQIGSSKRYKGNDFHSDLYNDIGLGGDDDINGFLDNKPAVSHKSLSDSIDNAVVDDKQWSPDVAISRAEPLKSGTEVKRQRRHDVLFLLIVGTCSLVGIVGLLAAALFWYKVHKRAQAAAQESEYPSYGVTGPSTKDSRMLPNSSSSDRKLAQSAQMFHYQQQRQQMMAQEKANQMDKKPVNSDDSDDDAPTGGDYTVYECPGLAPTGEMEVRNPLFNEPDPSLTRHYPQPPTSSSPPKEKLTP